MAFAMPETIQQGINDALQDRPTGSTSLAVEIDAIRARHSALVQLVRDYLADPSESKAAALRERVE